MKKPIILAASIIAFIGILICCFIIIFPLNEDALSDIDISTDAITAKQVYACVNEELEKYTPARNMRLGAILVLIDKSGSGVITLTYYEQDKRNPDLYYIEVDTREHKLVSMEVVENDERTSPMDMEFEKWVVDSDDVIEIAKENFGDEDGFKYDEIMLSAVDDRRGSRFWNCLFMDSVTGIRNNIIVDPFTGEITDSATWETR
jgi:hypothetical protein